MKPPFDIAADLDTPVSAYLKLKPFRPRFLLESVEGGERLARYSFIGFGDCLEVRLDERGLTVDGHDDDPRRRTSANCSMRCAPRWRRHRNRRRRFPACRCSADWSAWRATIWCVTSSACQQRARIVDPTPEAHYLAPRSMLVFDHLTRGVALLHAGSDEERAALRKEVIRALRGADAAERQAHSLFAADRQPERSGVHARRAAHQGIHRGRRCVSARAVGALLRPVQLEPFETYRALRLLNPSPYMYYCDLGDCVVVGSSPEALVKLSKRPRADAADRGHAAARQRCRARCSCCKQELLADPKENAEHVMLVDLARNDLGRVAKAGSVGVHPYRHIERYSHVMHIVSGVNGELAPGQGCIRSVRRGISRRHAGRRAESARDGNHR